MMDMITHAIRSIPEQIAKALASHASYQTQPQLQTQTNAQLTTTSTTKSGAGTIHVTPASMTSSVPPLFAKPTAVRKHRDRILSQPNLTDLMRQTGRTTTTIPTTVTSAVTTPANVSSNPPNNRPPKPSYELVQNTYRDQYVAKKVTAERYITNEDGQEQLQYLIQWDTKDTQSPASSWEDSTQDFVKNNGQLELKWVESGRMKWLKRQQDQPQAQPITTHNVYDLLADQDGDISMDRKDAQQTPGEPDTTNSTSDPISVSLVSAETLTQTVSTPRHTSPRNSHKRSRSDTSSSPSPSSAAETSARIRSHTPTSSRSLTSAMKPIAKKKRAAAITATQVIAQQTQSENSYHDEQ